MCVRWMDGVEGVEGERAGVWDNVPGLGKPADDELVGGR